MIDQRHYACGWAAGLSFTLTLAGCGGAVTSGVAAGKVGENLAHHTQDVPRGAEVCAFREALAAAPNSEKKRAWSESCAKELKRDRLWRGAMVALAAHGETLTALATGEVDEAGALEAARTGINGNDWIDVEEGSDKAAREAAAQLVEQMSGSQSDLEQAITDAAPHVKTLCDGLNAYLDEKTQALADLEQEIETKREAPTERRCGMLDGRSLCVSETGTDRVIYANVAGQLAVLVENHAAARDDVAAFCAAHAKLEEAAGSGSLDDDATHAAIVAAVRDARRGPPAPGAAAPAAPEAEQAPEPKAADKPTAE